MSPGPKIKDTPSNQGQKQAAIFTVPNGAVHEVPSRLMRYPVNALSPPSAEMLMRDH
jgi:hypothetical protein